MAAPMAINLEDTKLRARPEKELYMYPASGERPLDKKYFTGENFAKYEPCVAALQKVLETDGRDDDAWNSYEELFEKFVDYSFGSCWNGQKYDLVIYGTSGYTGYLSMQYLKLCSLPNNPEKYTVALSGRNAAKVAEQREKNFAGTPYEDMDIITASYDDPVSMMDLARSAKVIVNFAGPYSRAQGELMIDACCKVGTSYLDVSGELPWTFRALELDAFAKQGGACIIPSAAPAGGTPDVLTYLCAKHFKDQYGEETRRSVCFMSGFSEGSATSGGTLASRAAMNEATDALRARMADPFAIGGYIPDIDRNGFKECTIQQGTGTVTLKTRKEDMDSALSKVVFEEKAGVWRLPNLYAAFNTRMVRRSNALWADFENAPYGKKFSYVDGIKMSNEQHTEMLAASASGQGPAQPQTMSVADEKAALQARGEYYEQGQGPALSVLDKSWLGQEVWCLSEGAHERRAGYLDRDPYFATARCAIETALCLIFDKEMLPYAQKGGVMTLSVACQSAFPQRMLASGCRFTFDRWFNDSERTPPGAGFV